MPAKNPFPTLSDIRETCAFVTAHARHVRLNRPALTDFAKTITSPPPHWLITNPHDLLSLPLPLLATVLLYFETIDYSFWPDPASPKCDPTIQKWTIPTPHGPLDGSAALLYLLVSKAKASISKTFISDADASTPKAKASATSQLSSQSAYVADPFNFAHFSDADFDHFFHPAGTLGRIPLLADRAATLRETSHTLRTRLNNNFYAAIKNLTSDEQLFHFLITTFPSFRDQRTYAPSVSKAIQKTAHTPPTLKNTSTIHFYKLAQLLTSDLLFVRRHLEHISVDTSNLPGCADYKIPQTLRALDLISYDKDLAKLVNSQQLLPENSPFEVEIRAATVSAIDFLHRLRPEFSPIQINDYLFLASRNLKKKQPYHLTRTTNY